MPDTLEFELVSPEKLLRSEPVEMVVVPCVEGDIGVLPGHAPLIATVRPGVVDIHADGKVVDSIFVGGGFTEVAADRCTVLAEEAVPVADIDRAEAEERLQKAEADAEATEADSHQRADAERRQRTAQAMVAAADAASKAAP